MAKQPDKLSAAQERAVNFINSKGAKGLGAIGLEVGKMLAEICVELMDEKRKAQHWEAAFNTIHAEFKVAMGIVLRKWDTDKIVITRQDLAAMPPNTELFLDDHEPGVRVYQLRERKAKTVNQAVSRIIRPN